MTDREQLVEEEAIQALADGQTKSTPDVSSAAGDAEVDGTEDSDSETESISPLPTFMDKACDKEFTFRATLPHQGALLTDSGSLKRSKGHPSGPTPAPSPKKKRIRIMTSEEPLPPFTLNIHANSPAKPYVDNGDVFGGPSNDKPGVSDGGQDPEIDVENRAGDGQSRTDVKKANLQHYWNVESAEEKEQRQHREWERLRRDQEARKFQDEQSQMWCRDKVHTDNRERAWRCRALKREEKIEAGWVPGQKRVSVSVLTLDEPLTYLCRNFWRNLTQLRQRQARWQNYLDHSTSSRRLIGRRTSLQDGN